MSNSGELYPGSGIWLLPLPKKWKHDPKHWKRGNIYRLQGDLGFQVREGFVAEAIDKLGLKRMNQIRQLQFITGVFVGSSTCDHTGSHLFGHTRFPHVLRAAVLHLQILVKAGVEDRETVILGVWAELMHDMFLCAGGDSWKAFVQVDLFEEDNGFAGKLWQHHAKGWSELCQQHGLDPASSASRIEEIIHGQGLSGEIHEIADTASYILGDLEAMRKFVQRTGILNFNHILEFAASHEWDVWARIKLYGEKAVVQDLVRLGNFIQLRALLWQGLYNLPEAKFIELFLRNIAYPCLLEAKAFRKSSLLQKGDRWLLALLKKKLSLQSLERADFLGGRWPQVRRFDDLPAAQMFEAEMVAAGALTLLAKPTDFQRTSSKLRTYTVFGQDEEPRTFETEGPSEEVAEILEIVARANVGSHYVYYVREPNISLAMREAWRRARLRWK